MCNITYIEGNCKSAFENRLLALVWAVMKIEQNEKTSCQKMYCGTDRIFLRTRRAMCKLRLCDVTRLTADYYYIISQSLLLVHCCIAVFFAIANNKQF